MSTEKKSTYYEWEQMEKEALSPLLDRSMIHGERVMLAHVYLKKDCMVPLHRHDNEQFSYILEGSMRFWIGEEGHQEEILVRAGGVLHLPSMIPHKAVALEDTLSLDVFSPPRQDWLDGTDDYLRESR